MIAGILPAVPERSLPNSVLYENEDGLAQRARRLAGAYDEAGVRAWTVWVPEHHERARRCSAEAGHVLDATPTAMIADLGDVEPPRADDPEPDADPPRLEDLGRDQRPGLRDRRRASSGSSATGAADPGTTSRASRRAVARW